MRVVQPATRAALEIARRLRRVGINGYIPALIVSTNATVRAKPLSFQTACVIELGDLAEWIRSRRSVHLSEADVDRAVAAILRGDSRVSIRSMG